MTFSLLDFRPNDVEPSMWSSMTPMNPQTSFTSQSQKAELTLKTPVTLAKHGPRSLGQPNDSHVHHTQRLSRTIYDKFSESHSKTERAVPVSIMADSGKNTYLLGSNSWITVPQCRWTAKKLQVTFSQPIVLSNFLFKSSAGKQPLHYQLNPGKCGQNRKNGFAHRQLLASKNNRMKEAFLTYCIEIFNVSGYLAMNQWRHKRQKTLNVSDMTFLKCKC